MAAFYASEINNALVEVDGTERPIMDGSSIGFVEQINDIGVKKQSSPQKIIKNYEVKEEGKTIKIEPAESLFIAVTIPLKKIGRLNWHGKVTPELFAEHISSAHTFGA